LAAKDIGASDVLAPFTIGTFLIGAAASSVPSGQLFRAYGRYWGFAFGCLCQLAGCAVGSLAMIVDSIPLLFLGCFCVGLGQGLGQFYRFAAVEVASESNKSKAVTYVLTGGVLAAFLGPTSANYTKDFVSHEYFGSFLSMGVIGLLNWALVALVNFPDNDPAIQIGQCGDGRKSRPLREILSQPIFILSCTIATLAHTVMVSENVHYFRIHIYVPGTYFCHSGDDYVELYDCHGRGVHFPNCHFGAGVALFRNVFSWILHREIY
jgi:MFS family permease